MDLEFIENSERVFFFCKVNEEPILVHLLGNNELYYGTFILWNGVTVLCLCNPPFRETIKTNGLRFRPLSRNGKIGLIHVPTPLDEGSMNICTVGRYSNTVPQAELPTESSVPSLKVLAKIQVRSRKLSSSILREWYPPRLVIALTTFGRMIQSRWNTNLYNCNHINYLVPRPLENVNNEEN